MFKQACKCAKPSLVDALSCRPVKPKSAVGNSKNLVWSKSKSDQYYIRYGELSQNDPNDFSKLKLNRPVIRENEGVRLELNLSG